MDYRFRIARRYLFSAKQVSMISIITGIATVGLAIGVAALIVVLSVMNGFFDFVRDMLVSVDPHVRIVSVDERGLDDPDALMATALDLQHVQEAAPFIEGRALLSIGGDGREARVVTVRGVDAATLGGVGEIVAQTGRGRFDVERRDGRSGLVMGMDLARRLGVRPATDERAGDPVGLLSAQGIERMLTQPFSVPQVRPFELRGLYRLQGAYDESHLFIGLAEAQQLFRMGTRVTGVELRLDDIDRSDRVQRALQTTLNSDRFEVLTWYDLQRSLYDVMQLEKWGATLILFLIVIVAAFNIVGSLTMIVIEKQRDVGVLQAMGVSRKDIRRIFLLEGGLIGAAGIGAGFVLGLTLAWLQDAYGLVPLAGAEAFLIDAYPIAVQASDLLLIGGGTLLLCLLAAVYPAARASAVAPARAVQVEG